jgi:formate hydrogenlyase subunit 6/NADH:ubiquinone oxidoreductase subunit I
LNKKIENSGPYKTIKQLFTKPATTQYPFVKKEMGENYRGEPVWDFNLCIGCSLCARNCPSKAIDMVDFEGKKRPQFRLDKCIFCETCVEVCPKKAIKKSTKFEYATLDKSELTKKPKAADKKEQV